MTTDFRRRIDLVLDPEFVERIDESSPDDLRRKLRDARIEEDALSYVRRNLHGRLDLLRDALAGRRSGRGTDRGLEALAEALHIEASPTRGGRPSLAIQTAAVVGRRRAEQILAESHLARLPELSVDEIEEVVERVTAEERRLSAERRQLHEVIDVIETELAGRYKQGLEPSLERLQ